MVRARTLANQAHEIFEHRRQVHAARIELGHFLEGFALGGGGAEPGGDRIFHLPAELDQLQSDLGFGFPDLQERRADPGQRLIQPPLLAFERCQLQGGNRGHPGQLEAERQGLGAQVGGHRFVEPALRERRTAIEPDIAERQGARLLPALAHVRQPADDLGRVGLETWQLIQKSVDAGEQAIAERFLVEVAHLARDVQRLGRELRRFREPAGRDQHLAQPPPELAHELVVLAEAPREDEPGGQFRFGAIQLAAIGGEIAQEFVHQPFHAHEAVGLGDLHRRREALFGQRPLPAANGRTCPATSALASPRHCRCGRSRPERPRCTLRPGSTARLTCTTLRG